jgi:hypothetical protein
MIWGGGKEHFLNRGVEVRILKLKYVCKEYGNKLQGSREGGNIRK